MQNNAIYEHLRVLERRLRLYDVAGLSPSFWMK